MRKRLSYAGHTRPCECEDASPDDMIMAPAFTDI